MLVSVESSGALERRMRVQVPASEIDSQIADRLQRVGRNAKLEGFRPGKVPAKVIRQRYGAQVRQEVISDVMQSSYSEALQQEKLIPASQPNIEPEADVENGDFAYTAVFEVFPEISLKDLDKIKVEVPEVTIEAADVDAMLENLREQKANWQPVSRAAAAGDQVIADFEGTLDGEPIESGKGTGVPIVLGGGQMLDDFDQAMHGLSTGESKTFDVNYPDDYPAADLAGKTAQFNATVTAVNERELPEIDDEFIKSFGVDDGDVNSLRAEVEKNMAAELATKTASDIKQQILDQLISLNEIDVPQALVQQESASMQQEAMQRLGVTDPERAPAIDNFSEGATRRVQVGLLMQEFVRSESLTLDSDRVEAKMRELFSGYEDPEALLENYRGDRQFLQQIEPMVLEDQALDALRERGSETTRKSGFREYMDAR
ncbi:MAG: trigger factor [Pseudomonadota bacterium]